MAEGIEDALSFMQMTGQPCWSAVVAGGIEQLILPPEVKFVAIAMDNDKRGREAAQVAARRWLGEGKRVWFSRPPIGKDWMHEIKHDGYRMLARREGTRVRLFSRNGHDWSDRFPSIVEAIEVLRVRSCLIDGELVVCDESGLAVFELLRNGRQVKREAHLIAFDLVELDGRDLTAKPLQLRKAELARIMRGADAGLQLCDHIDQPGNVVFAHACQLGCEGIVSKRLGSRYRPGPTKCPDWIKVKNPAAPAVKREAEEDWN